MSEYPHRATIALTDAQYQKLKEQVQMRVMIGDVDIETWVADRVIIAVIQVIEEGTTNTAYLKE